MENRIFRKTISVDRVFYGFDPENILHFYFHYKWFSNSDAQRERERARRETRESEIGLAPSSSNHHPKPRRTILLWVRSLPLISSLSRSHQDRAALSIAPRSRLQDHGAKFMPARSCRDRAVLLWVKSSPSIAPPSRSRRPPLIFFFCCGGIDRKSVV